MSRAKAAGFLMMLCALSLPIGAARGADAPVPVKHYAFELETLNAGDKVRKGRTSFGGGTVEFKVAAAMSDDELAFVNNILDDLAASPPDDDGYRNFSMANGTRGRVGGFLEDPEVNGAAIQRLPVEFAVKDEFSTAEAALVLEIAGAGNLFVTSADDPSLAATKTPIADRRFLKSHKNYSVTPDANALVEWVRRNISPEHGDP